MSLIEIDWNPGHKKLRNFGIIALVASIVIAISLYVLKGMSIRWASIIAAFGFATFLTTVVSPRMARTIYIGMMLLTMPIGLAVGFVLMATFYFLLLTPLGLAFRLMGRDLLSRKFDLKAESYWVAHKPPERIDRYFRQF